MTDFLDPQAWRPDDSPVTYKDNDDKVVWRGDPSVHDDVVEVRRRTRPRSNRYPGVFKRGGAWAFRAQFGDGEDRWGVSGSGYPSAKEAYEAKHEAIVKARPLHGVTQRPDPSLTLAGYLRAWLTDHTATLRPSTAAAYRSRVNGIVESSAAQRRLRSMTEADYRALLTDLQRTNSDSNLRLKITLLKVALNAAVRAGLIPGHPLGHIKVSRTSERFEPHPWDVATAQKFLAHRRAANDPLYLAWHLALVTGMRRGEIHGLRWDDVDEDRGLLHVRRQRVDVNGKIIEQAPKTGSSEAPVHLDPVTLGLLSSAPRSSEYVIVSPRTGRPYETMTTFAHDWRRACRAANVPYIRFHDLRHTSASLLAALGVPLVLAKQRLRHMSQAMTERYTHALDGAGAQVAEQIGALVAPVTDPQEAA